MSRAWFLASAFAWFAVGWGTMGLAAGLLTGLLSFVLAVSAYLLGERYGVPSPGILAAGFGLLGPFIVAGLVPSFGNGERNTSVTIDMPART
ncbi:MAG: hypothetical protein WA954_11410 [Parerythrobacter sp.]